MRRAPDTPQGVSVRGDPNRVINKVSSFEVCQDPQKALRGGIPRSFLEPSGRSWIHFVGNYRQKLTRSLKN